MTNQDPNWTWWKHGVVYQIYPRSFYDTNGDGVGDLPGVIAKLDYLQDLGVDAIWLSPVNTSPMYDFGYDVSDYRGIDPLFGTAEDFDRLIDEAHGRDIRIVMDLVLNHTSHEHAWFQASRQSRDNPHSDWYIWHDGKNGKPPNNWRAMFGGRSWTWDEQRQQYYLHNFLPQQPDVNWRHPDLKKAIFDDLRYWLDKGIDGFRLDVINFLIKDEQLRDNGWHLGTSPRPYDLQVHTHDKDQPENLDLMKEFRLLTDQYSDRMMVGEIYAPTPNPKLSATYVGNGSDHLHMAFDFSIMYRKGWHARIFFEVLDHWYRCLPQDGWPCFVLSNHDQPRGRTRYGGGKHSLDRAKVAAALLLTARGTPFLYYGEELGMENGKVGRKELQDPVGLRYWPLHPGRDPERTPMLWSGDAHAGFSTVKPWLPLNKDWQDQHVEAQLADDRSMLHLHRRLLRLRRQHAALQMGTWEPLNDGKDNTLMFRRRWQDTSILVLLNFDRKAKQVSLPSTPQELLFSTERSSVPTGTVLQLEPHEATIMLEG